MKPPAHVVKVRLMLRTVQASSCAKPALWKAPAVLCSYLRYSHQ